MEAARLRREEGGGVLVMVTVWLPILLIFIIFVAEVGNWFEHKRHLQLQADAGALAGGGIYTLPCSDGPVVDTTRQYAGDPSYAGADPHNRFVQANQTNVHVLINSTQFWNKGGIDYSDGGMPCETSKIDVKITEADLPWFFLPGRVVPAVNAHARVEIRQIEGQKGALPIGVPDVNPLAASVTFIDEATGLPIPGATRALQKVGVANGLAIWANDSLTDPTFAPLPVNITSARIGVRVALSGTASTTTCGQPLVECYDLGSSDGILFVRGWLNAPAGLVPVVHEVTLFNGTCTDPYFFVGTSTCTVGVRAHVALPVSMSPSSVTVRATGGGCPNAGCPLTFNSGTGLWESGAANLIPIAAEAGPVPITLTWKVASCNGGGCWTAFANETGTVQQQVFSGADVRSGPIQLAQVWDSVAGVYDVNDFQIGTTPSLTVKIGIKGNLKNASDATDPVVLLRVVGSQNQTVDCDPSLPNIRDEIAQGCGPQYVRNSGTVCPATSTSLWSQPQPWNCVAIQTGGAVGQVTQGMSLRILGGANTCTAPNHWKDNYPSLPTLSPGDPRIVPVILTPFGAFSGSGNGVVPVTDFATFYVTGWGGNGTGNGDPCPGADPVPGAGYIAGHFIKYVQSLNSGGGGTQLCDPNAFGSCVAVLTQ